MERRLAAVLAADLVGYARLMRADETGTLGRLTKLRQELLEPLIARHHGRVVKLIGDGLLVEFASVVDALACAVAWQTAVGEHQDATDEDKRFSFRIGINIGDVIIEGDDIYGDGVNVAARLEGLAEPGGICVARNVYDQVKDKLDLAFKDLGERQVKNVAEPVRVFCVVLPGARGPVPAPGFAGKGRRLAGLTVLAGVLLVGLGAALWWRQSWMPDVEPASLEKMAFPLPDKPSIAVLPFANLSGDAEQDHLAAGMTSTLTTALSRIPDLFVIAHDSTMSYRGAAVPAKQVAEEQGVRYVLESGIQRSGDQLRVNTILIDALDGRHIWAEGYDRAFSEFFALQDDIAHEITVALQVRLTVGAEAQSRRRLTRDPEAFLLAHRAAWHYRRFNREDSAKARDLIKKAREIAPTDVFPLQMEGWLHYQEARFGWNASKSASLDMAETIARRALEIDDQDADTYLLLSAIERVRRNLDLALEYIQRAIDLDPNHAGAVGVMAQVLNYSGRPKEAIAFSEKAMRLSPVHPPWVTANLGLSYMMTGAYDEAIAAYEEVLGRGAMKVFSYERLAAIHALKGDLDKAKEYAAKLIEAKPDFTIQGWSGVLFYKNPDDLILELKALRRAGLPEHD